MPRYALFAGLVTVALWASAFVGIRAAGDELDGGPLALARLLVASAVLGVVVRVRREAPPPRRDVPAIALYGVLWFCLYNVALNEAERRVDAGTAAMLVNVGPILIAVLAGVVLREGFPRTLVTGTAVAFAGTTTIGVATADRDVDASLGALLCVAAAALYAGGVVTQKPLLQRTSALQITFLGCVVGAIACLPFAPRLATQAADASTGTLAWAVYLGVFPTALAFTTWAYALSRTTAGSMGALTYLVPPLAIGLGWLVLDETPPALALAGGALCVAGVVLTRCTPGARGLSRGRAGRARRRGPTASPASRS